MKKEYSKNERAKKVVGLRPVGNPIDFPVELGYVCPKNKKHFLEWSEYKYFLWCEQCNYDYPTPFCCKTKECATNVYLDILENFKK
jgi:hypothetical protein